MGRGWVGRKGERKDKEEEEEEKEGYEEGKEVLGSDSQLIVPP